MICPTCQSTETTPRAAEPEPHGRQLIGPALMNAVLVVILVCCGGSALVSMVTGGGPTVASYSVLGLFLALTVVDLSMRLQSMPAGTPWRCQSCGHVWSITPPVPVGRRIVRLVTGVILPWNVAAFLLSPRHRLAPEDPVIAVMSRVRVVLGLATVVGVALWYGTFDRFEPEAVLENWAFTAVLTIPCFLACLGLLVAFTRPAQRPATIRQLRWPLLSLAGFVVTAVLFVLFTEGADYVDGYLEGRGVQLPLDGVVYGGVIGLWLLVFSFRAAYLVAKNWFNAVDGHLLLPPVVATAMGWLLAGVALTSDGGGPPRPVSLVLILGGATATTVLAVFEGWRANRRYGVTLRDGPVPPIEGLPNQ